MSEPAAKQRSPIDLDEFERRLRGTAPALPPTPAQEDPLAELARLVGTTDRFRASPVRLPRVGRASMVNASPQRVEGPPPAVFDFEAAHQAALSENREGYAAELEAPYEGEHFYAQDEIGEAHQPRSRRNSLLMGGALALVLVGIAFTFAMKARAPVIGDAPTIKAAAGPIKVQPTNQNNANGDVADRNASLLDRSAGDPLASSKVVDNQEQPVDLQAMQLQRAAASPAGGPSAPLGSASRAGGYFPTPIRVHTVSVRPDGSVITDGAPVPPLPPVRNSGPASLVASNVPMPGQSAADVPPVNTAVADPPPRHSTATPKATPRVVATPKAPPAAAGAADYKADAATAILPTNTPIQLRSAPAKPARMAVVETGDVARATPKPAAAGSWIVQLAALGSEAEAQSELGGFQRKFPAELRGRHLAVQKGDSNGRTVFRVRVVGLTSDDANVLCSQIKAGGKSCFVKRD